MSLVHYIMSAVFVLFSGLFTGLTLGYMSLPAHQLKRKAQLGNTRAEKIFQIRKKGNQLLITLIIANVALNSALSIFLGSITAGLAAGIIATALIVVFAEIIPQAMFSRQALNLGYYFVVPVRILMYIFWPITKPMAMLLNRMLGEELPQLHSRKELKKIILEHSKLGNIISEAEAHIFQGGLSLQEKTVGDIMTKRKHTFFLRSDEKLDEELIEEIYSRGFSRIPILNPQKTRVVGILFAKDLIRRKLKATVGENMRRGVTSIKQDDSLRDVFDKFKRERTHIFSVIEGKVAVGIVTLEDVLEEIVGEIVDEFDYQTQIHQQLKED